MFPVTYSSMPNFCILGACPSIRLCSRIAPGFRWALAFSATAPALGAHYPPPQLVAALQERRQIFRRLWVKQISCHSADTFSSPRNKNLRIPRADLI